VTTTWQWCRSRSSRLTAVVLLSAVREMADEQMLPVCRP
jgi:hypothetical protein